MKPARIYLNLEEIPNQSTISELLSVFCLTDNPHGFQRHVTIQIMKLHTSFQFQLLSLTNLKKMGTVTKCCPHILWEEFTYIP